MRGRSPFARVVSGIILAIASPRVAPSLANAYDVDRTDDTASATACTAAPDDCSLRGAIIAANANPGPDVLNLPAGTYTLSIAGIAENAAATGDLDTTDDLTIEGAAADTTIIDGGRHQGRCELVGDREGSRRTRREAHATHPA